MTGRFLDKLRSGLAKTREAVVTRVADAVRSRRKIDEGLLEEIEEILIEADVGCRTAQCLLDRLRERVGLNGSVPEPAMIMRLLRDEIVGLFDGEQTHAAQASSVDRPNVTLFVGVNGSGKTTTVGKLAKRYSDEGKRVLIAGCDTFRAAAIDQLEVWAGRAGADFVRHQTGADPASVAFDAVSAACARGSDVVLVDTAGRLHTKVNLMEELKKVKRVVGKQLPGAPHRILLVLDATTGQNAVAQARQFHNDLGITGLVLTKLDGSAKGGVVISIWDELRIPISMVGVGEGVDDLHDFDPHVFAEALLG